MEHWLAGIRKDSAKRAARVPQAALPDHRLHAESAGIVAGRHICVAPVESVHPTDPRPFDVVDVQATASGGAEERIRAPPMDGNRVVGRPSDGVGFEVHARPSLLVGMRVEAEEPASLWMAGPFSFRRGSQLARMRQGNVTEWPLHLQR
jgi:hypothetical protein